MQRYKYHFLMHLVIFSWGFTGILGKLITASPEVIVWYRVVIATIAMLIFFPLFNISYALPNRKDAWRLFFVGIITCLHWVTFFKSIALSTASLGVLCLSTATLHVTWLEPLLMKRRFSWTECVLGGIVIYGIYFVSSDFNPQQYIALGYGLASAFFSALFSVANAKLAQTIDSKRITFYEMIAGVIFLSGILVATGQWSSLQLTLSDFWWLLFLGIVCTVLAFIWIIEVMKRLGVFTVSLNINLEPVYAILLAIVLLDEHHLLGRNFYIGSVLIVVVVIINAVLKERKMHKDRLTMFNP